MPIQFNDMPRIRLIHTTTPLLPLPTLSKRFHRNIFIKRDDINGVGVGGNKVRKLEYLLQDAINKKSTSVITGGGLQSNHAVSTSICATKIGLGSHLILADAVPINDTHYQQGANLVFQSLTGSTIHRVPAGTDINQKIQLMANKIQTSTGQRPYEIVMGGSCRVGALGYVRAGLELAQQWQEQTPPDAIVHASGSAGTQAGLILGLFLAGFTTRVIGISVLHKKHLLSEKIRILCEHIASDLGLKATNWAQFIHVNDDFIGPGYGLPTKETIEAIKQGIATEGVVFDPCYTGKAFHGLCQMIKDNDTLLGNNLVFLHTGGMGGLFAYKDTLSQVDAG